MGEPVDSPSIEALLSHQQWVGRLARSLVGDETQADDLVQDAWVAVLEKRMRHGAAPRAWLGRVLANLRRQRHRSEGARADREKQVASERLGSTSDAAPLEIVGRAETQHGLVADVLTLAEPYRSTLLLRYFDDLSAEEIGRLQGVPSSTVRNRLKRGLELLRARLRGRYGEEGSEWIRALLPIVTSEQAALAAISSSATTIVGWMAMGQGVKIAMAAIAVVAIGAWVWYEMDSTDWGIAAPGAGASSAGEEALAGASREREGPQLLERSSEPETSARTVVSATAGPMITGSVVSLDREAALEAVRIEVVPYRGKPSEDGESFTSDENGRFSLPVPGEELALRFDKSGFLGKRVLPEEFPTEPDAELRVVLAPMGSLIVQVVDHEEQPVADAVVSAVSRQNYDGSQKWSLFEQVRREGLTDGAGRCELDELPCGTTLSVRVRGGTHEFARIDPTDRSATLTLVRQLPGMVVGRIVEESLDPAARVEVELEVGIVSGISNKRSAWAGEDGRYRFEEIPPGLVTLRVPGKGAAVVQGVVVPGETLELDTITIPDLELLFGSVQSRFGLDPGTIAIDLLRDGRRLTDTIWVGSEDLSFETSASAGPLVVRVTQHDTYYLMNEGPGVSGTVSNFELGELLREEHTVPVTDLVLSVDATVGAVECRLEDEVSPEESVVMELRPLRSSQANSSVHTSYFYSTPEGAFRSRGFRSGNYSIGVSAPGGAAWFPEVFIPPNGVADLGTIVWAEGAIVVSVVDGNGEPIHGAGVNLRGVDRSGKRWDGTTDDRGRYRFEDLAAGLYGIEASHPKFGQSEYVPIELTGGEYSADLVLRGFGTVEVVLLRGGEPEPGVEVGLGRKNVLERLETSDARGALSFTELAPGSYALFVPQGRLPFTLGADETKQLTWELEREMQEVLLLYKGAPVTDLEYCHLVVVDPESELFGTLCPYGGVLGDRVLLPVIAERCALFFHLAGFDQEERWAQVVDGRSGRFPEVVHLSELELELVVASDVEAPRLRLIGFGGERLDGVGELPAELRREHLSEGLWTYRGIPEGALLSLEGIGADGTLQKRELELGRSSRLRVNWP